MAELETASRFNARPSGLATTLQNGEAPLRHFGMSRAFHKGETAVLIHPRAPQSATISNIDTFLSVAEIKNNYNY